MRASSVLNSLRCVAAGVLIFSSWSATQAAPFQNGSFEDPTFAGTTQFLGNGSTAIPGWTVGATGSGAAVVAHGTYTDWLPADDGSHVVVLNGDATGLVTSISQTFDTTSGAVYRVLFAYSRETPNDFLNLDNPEFSVWATGNSASNFNAAASSDWLTGQYIFTAFGASTTLTFSRTSGGEGQSPVLDNVRLSVVPEPSAAVLGGIGAACGLGALLARRRRRG